MSELKIQENYAIEFRRGDSDMWLELYKKERKEDAEIDYAILTESIDDGYEFRIIDLSAKGK